MNKKNFIILILIMSGLILVGCEPTPGPDDVVGISIDEKYTSEKIEITQVMKFIDKLGLTIHFGDESTEIIDFTEDMITKEDYYKLFSVGTHTIKVTYLSFETYMTVEVYKKIDEYFTVKVVYPDGNPVEPGIIVKWFRSSDFVRTTSIEEDGTSKIIKEDCEYIIRLQNLPVGYTYNPNINKINSDNDYLEIKLLEVSEFLEGTGSKNDPIALNKGVYKVVIDRETIVGMKVFAFQSFENKTVTIESLAAEKYTDNIIDPYIGFMGTSIDFANVDYSGNVDSYIDINFKYEFDAVAGKVYYFFIFASMAVEYPVYFYINIE